MATAGDIIDLVQLDFPSRGDTELLNDLQVVHNELCFDFKLKPSQQTNTSLVAGTQEYSLPSGTGRVDTVRYRRSATREDFIVLIPTHVDKLDELDQRWRGKANGTPAEFYIQNGKIGLVPPPDTSSSAGYPRLEIDVAGVETLSSSTTMPASVVTHQAWVEGTKAKAALRLEDSRYSAYMQNYMIERRRIGEQLNKMARQFKVTIIPNHATYGGRRRV